jgi:hypothetical protein
MVNVKYLKNGSLADLKANLSSIIQYYEASEPWLDKYFGPIMWSGEIPREMPEGIALKIPEGQNALYDLENTKTIYSALRDLPFTLAIDERFWAYLTHVVFWEYMRVRWPLKKALATKDPASYAREHYFFMGNRDRALIRNGISRLWWYGHVSYDTTRTNPFELTEVLLEKLDIAQQLLERSYSRNSTITKTILSMLVERKEAGNPFSDRHRKFRPLIMHLNAIGGVTILDALVEADIRILIESKLAQLDKNFVGGDVENEVAEIV